jgi:hypothetical protein
MTIKMIFIDFYHKLVEKITISIKFGQSYLSFQSLGIVVIDFFLFSDRVWIFFKLLEFNDVLNSLFLINI